MLWLRRARGPRSPSSSVSACRQSWDHQQHDTVHRSRQSAASNFLPSGTLVQGELNDVKSQKGKAIFKHAPRKDQTVSGWL
jgi:hypothetical protein